MKTLVPMVTLALVGAQQLPADSSVVNKYLSSLQVKEPTTITTTSPYLWDTTPGFTPWDFVSDPVVASGCVCNNPPITPG